MDDRNKLMRLAASLATAEDAGRAVEALSMMRVLLKQARQDVKIVEDAVMEWMTVTGTKDLQASEGVRYYVGTKKKTKCLDLNATLEAIITIAGGDIETVAEALSSNAIKPGHAKKVLGDAWLDHFEVTEELDLKTGKAKKELKLADGRYIRS